MYRYKDILAGFTLIILILIAIGGSSIYFLRDISRGIDDIYRHPFAVSNAAKSINTHLIFMQYYIEKISSGEDIDKRSELLVEIKKHEEAIVDNFNIIFDRFLGERSQIDGAYEIFMNWKPIREEIIQLSMDSQITKARNIINDRGAEYVERLNVEVGALVDFASKKAEAFNVHSQEQKHRALIILTSLCIFAVLAALAIAFNVLRNLISSTTKIALREHLIDQNIMMATLDLEGKIIDISNALCRFLERKQPDLIDQQSGFFDNSNDAKETQAYIWASIDTGKNWNGEIKHINKEGKTYWANSSILPNFDKNFQLTGYTNILTDGTSKKLAITDNLTTLFNRRHYEDVIDREMRLAKRHGTTLTLAIVDIDFFKKYNDHYGHPMGDDILSKVAKQMAASLRRPNDYIFRVGGEEFALIFSGFDISGSETFLNEIRKAVENVQIPHEHSSVNDYLTISICAHLILSNSSITKEELYVQADKALYRAKEKRNIVVLTS